MNNFTISKKDLRALIFWASVGCSKSIDGSYENIPEIIARWSKILELTEDDFCAIGSSSDKRMGKLVAKKLNQITGLRIKIGE